MTLHFAFTFPSSDIAVIVQWPNAGLPLMRVVGVPGLNDVVIVPLDTRMEGLLEDHLTCLFVASLGEMVAVIVALSPSTNSTDDGSRVIPVTGILPDCFSHAGRSAKDAKMPKMNRHLITQSLHYQRSKIHIISWNPTAFYSKVTR